jgi:hypothetical protein
MAQFTEPFGRILAVSVMSGSNGGPLVRLSRVWSVGSTLKLPALEDIAVAEYQFGDQPSSGAIGEGTPFYEEVRRFFHVSP